MKVKSRGFTIVELAIVLVVIGIILSMAVKGKSLVETARLRAEVNKIRKLEAAIHIYLVTHPDMQVVQHQSGHTQWGDFDMNYLYDNGILTKNDVRSMVDVRRWSEDGYWVPMRCQYYGDALNIQRGANQTIPFKPTNFCARIFSEVDENSNVMYYFPVPRRIQCAIEIYLDDEDVTTGVARYLYGYNSTNFTPDEYKNCLSLPANWDMAYDMGVVIY